MQKKKKKEKTLSSYFMYSRYEIYIDFTLQMGENVQFDIHHISIFLHKSPPSKIKPSVTFHFYKSLT